MAHIEENRHKRIFVDDKIWGDFLHAPVSYCRPADLPAQSRFDGLFPTGHGQKGFPIDFGEYKGFNEGYDIRPFLKPGEARQTKNETSPTGLIIARFEGQDNRNWYCNASPRGINFKDVFLVRQEDGWVTDTFPNKAEHAYFFQKRTTEGLRGIFMICTRWCDWGRCQPGHVGLNEIGSGTKGNMTIMINGRLVEDAQQIWDGDERCYLLKGSTGVRFGPPQKSKEGAEDYEIKFRVNRPGGRLFISAVVVF